MGMYTVTTSSSAPATHQSMNGKASHTLEIVVFKCHFVLRKPLGHAEWSPQHKNTRIAILNSPPLSCRNSFRVIQYLGLWCRRRLSEGDFASQTSNEGIAFNAVRPDDVLYVRLD